MIVETPTGKYLGNWETGSPEWCEARRYGLGGSEVAAVVGLSQYESAFALWHRKRGSAKPIEQTPAMEWGHYQEPGLLKWYQDKTRPISTSVGTFCHINRPWQICNPDALAEDRIVEAKGDHNPYSWGKPGTDAVPPYYRCQKLWYMDALGIHLTDLVASINGEPPEVWTMEYNADDAAYLREKAKDFLDAIDTGEEPAVDGHEQTMKVIRELHPDIDAGSEWYLDDETAETFLRACQDEKDSKEAKRKAAATILHAMGNAQYAVLGKRKIASRQTKGDGLPFLVASRQKAA